MSDKLLHFQCLISGFDYQLMKQSSTKSKKKALIYSNAILVIAIIWLGLGVGIGRLYGGGSLPTTIVLAMICPSLIILIERIIVQTPNNKWTFTGRFFIGLLISMTGSTLITQILFSNDIYNKQKQIKITEKKDSFKSRRDKAYDEIKESGKRIAGMDPKVDVFDLNQDGKRQSIGKTVSSRMLSSMKMEQEARQSQIKELSNINEEERNLDRTINEEMVSLATKRSILLDLKAMDQIISEPNSDGKRVLGMFNNQAHLFRTILFLLILAFELLVVLIKFATRKDEFDYQFYLEGSDRLGIDIAKSKFDHQWGNFKAQGSRDLVEKLLKKNINNT
ncbi:MAG: DUF4407 domain-containing protein [Holophagaceae bacterium]